MKTVENLLDEELAKLHEELCDIFINNPALTNVEKFEKEKIFIWLFRNNRAADTLTHWRLYPIHTDEGESKISRNDLLKSSTISGGEGTVGYVLKSGKIELVNNTFLDPRGAVTYEDEIIKNYSWAGVPIPTEERGSGVDCVISFFYQEYNFFKIEEQSDEIIKKLKELINKFTANFKFINQIAELTELNNIIYKSKDANTFQKVLALLNKVLSISSKYNYTGILSVNANNSFRLEQILFNTSALENKIKDTINFCNICKNKCVENCFEKNIQDIRTFTDLEASHNQDNFQFHECEVWKNYFNYIRPSYLLPVELGTRYKIFYYFSYPLSDVEIDSIVNLNKFFYDSFLAPISDHITKLITKKDLTIKDKENKIKLLKRSTETIFFSLQLLVDYLYKNLEIEKVEFEKEKLIQYINILVESFRSIDESLNLNYSTETLESLQDKIDNTNAETSFSKKILATEFWENIWDSAQIVKMNSFEKMNEIKKNAEEDMLQHSTLSVLKRAIEEEKLQQGSGNIILQEYSTNFFIWDKQNEDSGFIPNENLLKLNSFLFNWDTWKSAYLHALKIHETNFSSRVLNNIKESYSQMRISDVIFSTDNTFIDSEKDFWLFPGNDQYNSIKTGQKIIIVGIDEQVDKSVYASLSNYAESLHKNIEIFELEEEKNKHAFKSAIISILVDSYAHNISAHSLSALKWWFELRAKMLEKRIYVGGNNVELKKLQPANITIERSIIDGAIFTPGMKDELFFKSNDPLMNTTRKYYEILGLSDSTYNAKFYSLFDYLQFIDNSETDNLFMFFEPVDLSDNSKILDPIKKNQTQFNARFPVPIDYALFPFFRFLRDKGAFWSGVTRDMAFGGESKTWYKILWDDFANNPLYLGTIAKSEGISKLNIHLAVKHEGKWIKGRFVTIDMSVIDYEMANSANLTVKSIDQTESCINRESENNQSIDDCGIDEQDFSRYAFVRPGGCFKNFREILDTPEYAAFMPGGVVGEHALFTIFENTLRNIKHYKNSLNNIKENGIDFWISIEDESLTGVNIDSDERNKNSSNKTEESEIYNKKIKKSQLFKISTWLAHETEIFDASTLEKMILKNERGEDILDSDGNLLIDKDAAELKDIDKLTNKFLLKKVTDSSLSSIIDPESGTPRMGGNSQDKACTAMLFNNEFKSVERIKTDRDKKYFPWIHFSHDSTANLMDNIEIDINYRESATRDATFIEYLNLLLNKKIESKGFLKKSFKVWRGEDYFTVKDEKELYEENVSRFKIVLININEEEEKETKIKEALSEAGVIRILKSSEVNDINIEKIKENVYSEFNGKVSQEKGTEIERRYFRELYRIWLNKWFGRGNNELILMLRDGESNNAHIINDWQGISFFNHNTSSDEIFKWNAELNLSHGGKEEDSRCNVRSHGQFWNYFFSDIDIKEPAILYEHDFNKSRDHLLCEIYETVATRVMIFDNRIYRKFEHLSGKKKKIFQENLNLVLLDEDLKNDVLKSITLEEKIDCESKYYNNIKNAPHILIMHLSFIENISDEYGNKYSEERMFEFIDENLKKYFLQPNFVFVVVTGRGRENWRLTLKAKDINKDYITKTIFKPIESLLNAVESGISYNDNFDVKHHICKVIFGS